MRKLFLFQFLFLGIVFFTFSVSDVFATPCGVGGTCQTAVCSGTLIPEGGTPVCSTAPDLTCCKPNPSTPPIGCPTNFVMKSGVCFPDPATSGIGLSDAGGTTPVYTFLVNLMDWLLGIIGVLGVIAFVISGTQYLVSAGDEEMAKTAKRNMTYAIIGLAVALCGLIIINAIAGLTGAGGGTAVY